LWRNPGRLVENTPHLQDNRHFLFYPVSFPANKLHNKILFAKSALFGVRHKLEKVDLNYQNHILIVGQDIEEVVALMCYLQISMLGVAGYIKVGNTLTNPISSADTMENYWFTPMYFSDVWHTRRIIHKFTELFEKGDTNEKQP
jgi:hypothetical protein